MFDAFYLRLSALIIVPALLCSTPSAIVTLSYYHHPMGLVILILVSILLLWLFGAAALVYSLAHPPRKTYAAALGCGDPTDPADLELVAREMAFTFTDHTTSPGWIMDGQNAGGPTVVLIHGFSDSRYGLLQRVPFVLPYAHKIVVFDLPGQGESECARSFGGLREPDDLLAVLSQLEPDDARSIILLGVSMGAGIAIAAAAKSQSDLRSRIHAVIAEAPYRFWDQPIQNIFKYRRYPRFPIIPLAGLWLRLTHKQFKHFDRARYAANLPCPLLVLHGSDDRTCPPDAAQQIADAAPNATYIEIPAGQHNNLPFDHAETYAAAVSDFLQKLGHPAISGKMQSPM